MKNKKILAIYSSPSKGRNSDTMMDNFISGISDTSVEKVYLNDINFDSYSYDNRTGPKDHEEEFKKLTDKMQEVDGIIMSTPTYNFSVPSKLKNLIDRIRFFALDMENRNKFGQPVGKMGDKHLYFIVSGGTPNWAQKILFFAFPPFWLRGVFLYCGAKCLGSIYSGDVKTFENKKVLRKCKRAGHIYEDKLLKRKGHGFLHRIFWRPPQVG